MDLALAAHAHEVMHIILAGVAGAPETEAAVTALLEDFSERARPIMQEQLRADLLTTPPDDRNAEWHRLLDITEEEN
jgi:hypothetical protein